MRAAAVCATVSAVVLLAATGAGDSRASLSQIRSIEVRSSWMGLPGETQEYTATIVRRGDRFWSSSSESYTVLNQTQRYSLASVVPNERIQRLLAAATDSIRNDPVADDFGFTKVWRAAHADSAFRTFIRTGESNADGFFTPEERKLYTASFENGDVVSAALKSYYSQPPWTDDENDVTVTVHFSSGPPLIVESQSQRTFMLPWAVSRSSRRYVTYDPAVSAAVEAFLPPSAGRYGRLSPEQLRKDLPGIVGKQIKAQWDKVPRFALYPQILALEARYDVRISAEPVPDGDEPMWGAKLRWDDLPPGVTGLVGLPIVNNSLVDTGAIPAARTDAVTAANIPWVSRVLHDPRGVGLEVVMEHGSSHPTLAQQREVLADLKAAGRLTELASIEAQLPRSSIVSFDEPGTFSQWILMPDRKMLLWTYYDARPALPILDLSLEQMRGRVCANQESFCSGIVRLPNGDIETNQ